MHEPELLILDEPIAGLDPLVQQSFHELLARGCGAGPHGLPLVAHVVRGRAGRPPGRDPAPGAARRGRHAREPPERRRPAARDRVLRGPATGRRAPPSSRRPGRAGRRSTTSVVSFEGAADADRQGDRRLRRAIDPQPRRRTSRRSSCATTATRPRREPAVFTMALRLRVLPARASPRSGMATVILHGRRALPGGRRHDRQAPCSRGRRQPARRRRLRHDHRLDAQRDRRGLRTARDRGSGISAAAALDRRRRRGRHPRARARPSRRARDASCSPRRPRSRSASCSSRSAPGSGWSRASPSAAAASRSRHIAALSRCSSPSSARPLGAIALALAALDRSAGARRGQRPRVRGARVPDQRLRAARRARSTG